MSKLNCLRIVNLNYNNNSMKINDALYEFGGESTLMNLRNGGGKTVLVQMIMAPFVNKKYRDLKDRTFESYFNSQTPTYILTEWVLDGDSSYVLIGMAVRKKPSTSGEEESEDSDELEILNFIHEYRYENEYSIRNLPVIERDEKISKVKSFGNFKKLLEEIKKSRDFNLNYFDMRVSSQSRNYFKNLKEYKINNKEWESIIKKINMKESGLSELFQDTKSIAGLVEKWFIKTVEDKLNKEESKISNFKDIMMKFIYQYKENEAKLKRKAAIESFREEAQNILDSANEFTTERMQRKAIENNIANLIEYIEDSLSQNQANEKSIREELENIKLQLKDIEYEKYSSDYYKIIDEIDILNKELNIKNEDKEEKIKRKGVLNKEKGILECARIYEDYKYHSSEVQRYENQLELKNTAQRDTEEERINIGFTLKEHFEREEKFQKDNLEKNIKNTESTESEISEIKDELKITERRIRESDNKGGEIKGKISSFNKAENNFNKRYHKSLARNMMGYYDEVFIDKLKNSYEEEIWSLKREHDKNVKQHLEEKNKLSSMERNKENIISEIESKKSQIKEQKKQKENIEKEILRRKEILKYIDVKEDKFYDREYLLDVFSEKLEVLREDEKKFISESIKFEEEISTLKTGRTLKLPIEIESKLNQRGINILYGIDWLKKNSYSSEENLSFVERNPFIPYSLVMEEEEIKRLKNETLDVFTYNPIPIINRKTLNNAVREKHKELCTLGEVSFYISFNNKLLDEIELGKLVKEKENELTKIKNNIDSKREDIEQYERLKNEIINSDLKKGDNEKLVEDIYKEENYLADLEKSSTKLKNDIEDLKKSLENLNEKINFLNKGIENKEREYEEYKYLLKEYKEYKEYKKEYEEINRYIDNLEKQHKEYEALKNNKEEFLKALKNQSRDIEKSLSEINKEFQKYIQYKNGVIIEKDIEDLKARYDALTSKISKEIQEIQEDLQRSREQFNKKQNELISHEKEYNLQEKEYTKVVYERFRENEVKKEIQKIEKEIEEVNRLINKRDKDRTAKEVESKNILKAILKEFQKDYAKKKEEIIEGNFEGRISSKRSEIKELGNKLDGVQKEINILNQNLSGLDEYNEFSIVENIEINIEVSNLRDYKGRLLRDYKEAKERERLGRDKLSDEVNKVAKIEIFSRDDFFKKSLDTLIEIIDEPENIIETTEKLLEAHKMILDQLQEDLEIIHREKDNIIEIFYEYALEVHESMGKIDKNSTIKIKDKYVKMLQIELPDWENNKELYRIRVRDFIDSIIEKAVILLNDNKNIEDMISSNITTVNLYNEVVSISSIDVKLYKIEEDRQIKISWNEVSKNSGGEGFLSAFVILSSLLSYMRRDESDIFTKGNEGKVLVMDNPFAQTNAEHLLKPLMDIAKRSNTQLICFTGLGGESIYNRFDNIYVLDFKDSKLKNGTQKYLFSNHIKGEDSVSEIISSRFKIKEESIEQMELF